MTGEFPHKNAQYPKNYLRWYYPELTGHVHLTTILH